MDEIADMMLEGVLCEMCGVVVIGPDEEPQGYPKYCSQQCAEDRGAEWIGEENV